MLSLLRRRVALLAGVAMLAACSDQGLPTASEVGPTPTDPALSRNPGALANGGRPLRVMTRNLYLGGEIGPILGALATGNQAAIPGLVGETWASVQANDFPSRAEAIAAEVASARPDVIGLQEVALFRVQSPGDFLAGNPVAAQDVAYDYLELLLDELRAAGLHYRVATAIDNVDIELPALTPSGLLDVRYTDRDVVLVGPGVQIQDAMSAHFTVNVSFPAVGVTIFRSWNRVDLKHRGREITFVNTHPETDEASPEAQEAQAQELVGLLAGVDRPTIVVGDLNGTPTGTQTYGFFQAAGFVDAWTSARPGEEGLTCCFKSDLSGGTLFERIDYVLARGSEKESPLIGEVLLVGDGPTPEGVLASDHVGIVADVGFAKAHGRSRR